MKHALRSLLRSRGFTAIAIVTLALGIGLNTSMFSLMNLLILRPLPYPASAELARVYRTTPQSQTLNHSAPDFLELSRETASFAQLAAFRQWGYTMTPEGRAPVNLNALRVSASFFPTLGLQPAVGRFFNADEDRDGNHVIMLGYDAWQAHFGGDPAIVGRNVLIDGESTTIVGVMPASFASVFLWGPSDAFRPLALTDADKQKSDEMDYNLIARRHHDLTPEQFNSRLATLATRLAQLRPRERSQDGLRAVSLDSAARPPTSVGLSWLMLGLAGFVLLIACANLANLQLARAIARSHEFAIRAALGASRSHLLRPLLAESLLLSIAGGLLGLLVAVWTNDWVSSRLSDNGIYRLTLVLDWRVLSFAMGVSVVTGLFFGLVPAWRLARVRGNDSLKSGNRGNTGDRFQHRVQHSLIVTQFANALILLAGAAGFIRVLDGVLVRDPGWRQTEMVQAVLNLPAAKYSTPAQTYAFYTQLQERLAALPGVEGATVGWTLPVFQFLTTRTLVAEGQPAPVPGHEPVAYINAITPSYLATLGLRLQSGRNFNDADTLTSVPVAIINASMARALFPGENAVGHRIGSPDPKNPAWFEIVGVVPDIRFAVGVVPGSSSTPFQVLRPLAQETWNYVSVAVRSRTPGAQLQPLRQTIAALDPNLVLQQFGTIADVTKIVTGGASMLSTVLVSFALLGLFLAALGLYGVIARVVVQRTPEIGVRVALGAQSRDVVWLILRTGLRLTLIGSALGLLGAAALGWGLGKAMSVKSASDPLLFAGVTAVLVVIGLVACWLPARRAAKVDPMVALRAE
jgi:predicted permease